MCFDHSSRFIVGDSSFADSPYASLTLTREMQSFGRLLWRPCRAQPERYQ
jgi:hypothetical protein